ncbi:hypothetical protein BFJ72_g6785 [Fusarium proliferatum]|uniref:Uncharacterized protein n=1 Tax=Gibberella intermedia TaxID=948311 RepID=A0A420TCN0_GIBIN|nr:hypothetical protein BFJ72_g6785 [Fusarium proliferatum]
MFAIETVTLAAGQQLPLTVANTTDHLDPDCFKQPTKGYHTGIIYDAQSGQVAPRTAVVIQSGRTVLFTVRVRLSQELQDGPIVLLTDKIGSTWYLSYEFGTNLDPDIVVFNMMIVYSDGPGVWNPGSLLGATQFYDYSLKYNTASSTPSFVLLNPSNPDTIPALNTFSNYGGCFQLSALLDADRNFKQSGAITLVNCYDQAGAGELAASFGVNYDCITWEIRQAYAYISKKTELVGWGHCINPHFDKNPPNKVLGEKDTAGQHFASHAFLSWDPEFGSSSAFYLDKTNPTTYTDVNMLVLDACAGPHLGNETRGVWVIPTSCPPGYTDKSRY